MFSREALEKLLILNGLEPTAPDEQIKSVLLRANWRESEVDTAISILREDATHEKKVDTIHRIFQTDEKLSPENISSLLGISVDYSNFSIEGDVYNRKRSLTSGTVVHIVIIALGVSLILALGAMYQFEFGIFHPSSPLL